jgi:FkbM family methyltransferase
MNALILKADGLEVSLRDPGTEGSLGDRAAFAQVFLAGEYDFLLNRILSGDTVLDAGANIGCFTLRASRRVGSTGLVIAVEPESSNASCLEANLRRNGISNVVIIRNALGAASNETVNIVGTGTTASVEHLGTPIWDPTAGTSRTVVRGVTVDEMVRETSVSHLDIIKVDIEGSEKPVFATDATSQVLATARAIAVEVHDANGSAVVRNRIGRDGFSYVSPIVLESDFIARAIRGALKRPDLVLKLYGVEVAPIFARIFTTAARARHSSGDDVLGLIFASR